MRLDSSGNLGLGVTPSAWSGVVHGLQIGGSGSAVAFSLYSPGATNGGGLASNAYYNGGWKYIYSSGVSAGRYEIEGNVHSWYTAPVGSAGGAITFTQAMTLDASGNLGVGTSTPSTWGTGGKLVVVGSVTSGGVQYSGVFSDGTTNQFNIGHTAGYVRLNSDAAIALSPGSSPKVTISTGGIMQTAYQPFYQGYTSPSTAFSSTWQVLNYSSAQVNTGNCYNTSNGRFTAPAAGVYSINAIALVSAASSTTADYRMAIRKNGSEAFITSTTKPVGYATIYVNFEWYLAASDYIEICFYNDAATGNLHPDASFTRLSIRLAG
jgi:hypothetical protein